MSEPEWIKNEIRDFIKEYGSVPPPWFIIPGAHPYDMCWRMGGGESHVMLFGAWWKEEKEKLDESQRIDYFRKWPPPPVWLPWMMDIIWDLDPWASGDSDSFDYSPYFERTKALGFGSKEEYDYAMDHWDDEEAEEEEEEEEEEKGEEKRKKKSK